MGDCAKDLVDSLGVSGKTRKEVKRYLLYKNYRSTVDMFGGFDLLNTLSDNLKSCVYQEFALKHFPNVVFLHRFHPSFVKEVAPLLSGSVYAPSEWIIRKYVKSKYLFFLAAGELEVLMNLKV